MFSLDEELRKSHTYQVEVAAQIPARAAEERTTTRPQFNLTDIGNAERFANQHRDTVRFCNLWKKWIVWDGKRWTVDNSQTVKVLARQTVRSIYREASQEEAEQLRKAIAQHGQSSEGEGRLRAMISLAQMDLAVQPEELDKDPWLLNVQNGTVDLRTGELRSHRKEDLLSKMVQVIYDPKATAPLWEAFLSRIFDANEELIEWLQRAVGYSLSAENREQVFFLCHGVGANGKSTFLNTLKYLLGDYSEQAPFQTFLKTTSETVRNDLAKLQNCRFVSALEAEEGRKLSEVVIKQLTGGDPITARFLYGEYFTYVPQFKIWMATNHKPTITGTDYGIWRRVKLIPFEVVIPPEERDEKLSEKLTEELPGILAWAVHGCLRWQEQRLVPEPEIVKIATEQYRTEEDVLGAFLTDRCISRKDLSASAADLFETYQQWAKTNGEEIVSQKKFGGYLTHRGFRREKSSLTKKIVWHGVGLDPAFLSGSED